LRIIENNWKKRADQDKLGRAKPSLCAKYVTGNLVLKTPKREFPVHIFKKICTTCYSTRRHPDKYLFHDKSKTKFGFQSIENRVGAISYELDFDSSNNITEDFKRISLKRSLKMINDSQANLSDAYEWYNINWRPLFEGNFIDLTIQKNVGSFI